jgi:predicted enzyme related to lactoylglutathione lyase
MSGNHGQFIWYDLITPDPEGAERFYCEIAGWGTQVSKGPQDYTMWENEGIPMGGIVKTKTGMGDHPYWLPYVSVDNVDETARLATTLGAKITSGPKDIPASGRYAVLEDPQGAAIAIFKSRAPSEASEFNPGPGQVSWHELMTDDYGKALEFYNKIFGWEPTSQFDMGPMGMYQMYGKGKSTYGGMMSKTPESAAMPSAWGCYIMVDDAHKTVAQVPSLGGRVLNGPMSPPGGDWVAQCVDPQGVYFGVHSKGAS